MPCSHNRSKRAALLARLRYPEIDIEPPAGYEPPPPRIEEVPVAAPQLTAVGLLADEE